MSNRAIPVDADELRRLRESHAELLAALELIAGYELSCSCTIKERMSGHRIDCTAPEFHEMQAYARAAIAKATL
jgi:hypothetical protein